jgi:hypothetical protein
MNLKRIIREELSDLSGSFYLLVSDDENFIYGTGKFSGMSFQPVENFDAEAILRSKFRTKDDALEQISWAEYYKGSRDTPGEIADNMLKHNPKVVPVDFILRKRDESFPIIESNELDWIKDVDPMSGGEYFNDSKAICFGDNQRHCDVRINNKYITFYFSESDFSDIWENFGWSFDDERWVIEPIIRNGVPYDGEGDWFEIDSDEFNYSYYHFEQDQLNRVNEILNTVGSDKDVGEFEDSMNSLIREFKHPKLQSLYDNLIGNYLNELGYIVQANRWLSVSRAWQDITNKAGISVRIDNMGDIVIQVPLEVAYEKYYNTSEVTNLTDLMNAIIKKLSDINWYDWFTDEWDTSGGEEKIDNVIDTFLDEAENYLESEDFEKWEKVLSDFEKLGIKTASHYWYNFNQFQRENPNQDTIWSIKFKDNFNKADLELYKKQNSRLYSQQVSLENHKDVPVEEIPKYIKPLD